MDNLYYSFTGVYHNVVMLLMPIINGGKVAYFSSFTIVRGVMEHPWKKFKLPREALFVIVLRTPTKELLKLPIFNSVVC